MFDWLGEKAQAAGGWIGGRISAAWTWFWGQPRGAKVFESVGTLALLVAIVALIVVATGRDDDGGPDFPADGPAEFLYLDSSRVIAYLAQIDGGTFTSKTLTHKLTDSATGKLGFQDTLELGGTISREDSVSRVVTPTAAANYFELLEDLEELDGGIARIGIANFGEEVKDLSEGQFVMFETHALRPPVYVNAYLALRQKQTVSTLFPMPDDDPAAERRVRTLVRHSLHFREAVGGDPRAVFALRPVNEAEKEERQRSRRADRERRKLIEAEKPLVLEQPPGLARAVPVTLPSAEEIERRRLHEEEHVQYLMPLDAQLLTRERSLLKFGGGTFTVVGKVVRKFPAPGNHHQPVYVDSPTAETWAQPLLHAPPALLCRTDPRCTRVTRADGISPERVRTAKERAKARTLEALAEQTVIPHRGAVILPIAIYK